MFTVSHCGWLGFLPLSLLLSVLWSLRTCQGVSQVHEHESKSQQMGERPYKVFLPVSKKPGERQQQPETHRSWFPLLWR